MDWSWIWKAIIIVIGGTMLLRFAGRKSISQMTLAQTVIMIGIGSLLIQPLAGKSIWTTLGVGTILVVTLFLMELAQVKSDTIEKIITGKSKILIKNGQLNEKNLRKLRFTVDQLEMNLRQKNVTRISDVEYATLEPNGQLGFTLKQDAQPVTRKQFNELQQDIQQIKQLLLLSKSPQQSKSSQSSNSQNLFTEVDRNAHNEDVPPKHLQ